MLIEAETIPYERARLLGERLLVLAPHPDDEVIGCGGLVAAHLRDRRRVRVIVATDGTAADTSGSDSSAYRSRREAESREGLRILGGEAELVFLGFPDRGLDDGVAETLREQLRDFKPDLVCVPSPIEIHPDHLALSRAFCILVEQDPALFAELATTRVAFYEVGQPVRPNALVDITDVADAKYEAIEAHQSQISERDYVSFARGLNAYRAMTLPSPAKFAEGYFVIPLPELRTVSFDQLRGRVGNARTIEVKEPKLSISVLVRTRDRAALLTEALASIRSNDYPAEIVVVNDGGVQPALPSGVKLVEHSVPRGRSAAMNSAAAAASGDYLAFLDDDDLYYPEHLATVARAAEASPSSAAWYSDAVSAFLHLGESGSYETRSRLRLFEHDFDRDLLLADNFIPLPTLLVRRADYLAVGGFDTAFDLFEDWDFLIRLSERGGFRRIPRVTCEVRHFEGGSSIILDAPEGSERFRAAKQQVWQKHAAHVDSNLFAAAFEKQKRHAAAMSAALVEKFGELAHGRSDLSRLEREKGELIGQIQELHNSINGNLLYVRELEGTVQTMTARLDAAVDREARVREELLESQEGRRAAQNTVRATYAEIERLQGLLDLIYGSRTWKLHSMMEKIRGRG